MEVTTLDSPSSGLLSFLLVFVIAETAVNKRNLSIGKNGPVAIGLAVFMAHVTAIPFTGASINPARSFGPAIISGKVDDLWLYFVAPILGGIIAAMVTRFGFQMLIVEEDKVVKGSREANLQDYISHEDTLLT